jgi:hypothetical protein
VTDWADPNHLFPAAIEQCCHIYGDDNCNVFAVVDPEDYQWAIQWLWSPKWSRGGRKMYLRRSVQTGSKTRGTRVQKTLFLHTAIMQRTGIKPPTPLHKLIDHRDGDGLNCRRSNLRWATHSMNVANINGSHAHDLVEG